MIAKIITGSGFKGLSSYALHDKDALTTERATVLDSNFSSNDIAGINREFSSLYKIREVMGKEKKDRPIKHIVLSAAHSDKLTEDQWKEIASSYLEELGYKKDGEAQTHYAVIRHSDTQHDHLHLITSVMKFDGNLVETSNERLKALSMNRRVEDRYNLQSTKTIAEKSANKFTVELSKVTPDTKAEIKSISGFGRQTPKIKMMCEAFGSPELARNKFLTSSLIYVSKQDHYTKIQFKNNISVIVSNKSDTSLQTITLKSTADNPAVHQLKSALMGLLPVVSSPVVASPGAVTPAPAPPVGRAPQDAAGKLLEAFQQEAWGKPQQMKVQAPKATHQPIAEPTPTPVYQVQAPVISTADLEGSLIALMAMIEHLQTQFKGGVQLYSIIQHNNGIAAQIASLRKQMQQIEAQIAQAKSQVNPIQQPQQKQRQQPSGNNQQEERKEETSAEEKQAEQLAKEINSLVKNHEKLLKEMRASEAEQCKDLIQQKTHQLEKLLILIERNKQFKRTFGLK